MLRSCSADEFVRYADHAYRLATDPARSGYPTYCDGVKTKEMFVERSMKAFERDTEQMLLFESEGKVQGLIHLYRIPEDRYLGTCLFLTDRSAGQAVTEFLAYARENFPGYELFTGFPAENREAVEKLEELGSECIESDYNNTSFLDTFGHIPETGDTVLIGKENYGLFQKLHSLTEGDMYWNSERILDDLESWRIFVKEKDGKALGAVYCRDIRDGWFEIFGVDLESPVRDEELFRELLLASVRDAAGRNGKVITFFCEEEYQKAAEECGLRCIGKYLCYKTVLS